MSDPSTPTQQLPPAQPPRHPPGHAESRGANHAPYAPAADDEHQRPRPQQPQIHRRLPHEPQPQAPHAPDAPQEPDGLGSDEALQGPPDLLHPNPRPNQSHQILPVQPHPPQTLLAANAPELGVHLLIGMVIDDADVGWFRQNRNYVKAYQKLGRTVIGETAVCTIGPLQIIFTGMDPAATLAARAPANSRHPTSGQATASNAIADARGQTKVKLTA